MAASTDRKPKRRKHSCSKTLASKRMSVLISGWQKSEVYSATAATSASRCISPMQPCRASKKRNVQPPHSLSIKGGQAPKERSKAELLKCLLDGTYPELNGHSFVLQTNYLVCTGCNGRILRHAASEKIEGLAKSKCWNQEWIPDGSWKGHKSHKLWRKGGRVTCLNCKAQALPKDGTFEVSRTLRRICGQTSTQHTLPTLFTSQNG